MPNRLLILFFLIFFALPLQAKWTAIDQGTKHGEKHFVDWETIDKNEHFRKVWVLSSYEKQQPGQFHSLKTHYEFNCIDHKTRIVTLLFYPDENAATTPNGARHAESEEWFDFSKQSILHYIAARICDESLD